MTVDDLAAVQEIERESFTTPWPPHAYRQELETNRLAHYIVARYGDADRRLRRDVADGGRGPHHHLRDARGHGAARESGSGCSSPCWTWRRRAGRARRRSRSGPRITPARRLYEKYGFAVVGLRPRYYSDDNEDALIMTTESLDGRPMRERLARLRAEVAKRPDIELGDDGLPIEPAGRRPRPGDGRRRRAAARRQGPTAATPSRPTCSGPAA